jgi:hypothetical protein
MTNITVAVPDELAARTKGVLDPQRLTALVCEMLVRVTSGDGATADQSDPEADDCRSMYEPGLGCPGISRTTMITTSTEHPKNETGFRRYLVFHRPYQP